MAKEFKAGDRVRFRPTHQKDLELTGTVDKKQGDDARVLNVKSDAGAGSVSRVYPADINDVKLLEEEEEDENAKAESKTANGGSKSGFTPAE
jgi:hypothetical protein